MTDAPSNALDTETLFQAMAGEAVEAKCIQCGAVEWVIPLDGPMDDIFFANYHCDECDDLTEATEKDQS